MAARSETPSSTAPAAHAGQPGWRRDFALLCFAQFCAIVGFSLALPFLPLYVQTLGVPEPAEAAVWAGAMSSTGGLTMAVMAPLWGSLADRYGRKPMVTRSMFGASLFVAAMAFAGDVRQLFALRAAQGLFSGTVPASRLLAASIVPSDRLGQTMGLMGTAQFVGSSFAPLVGGLVAESLLAGFPSGSRGSGVVASRGNGEMAIDRRVTTAEELLRLPDDGIRRELIDGELRTMSPTGAGHGEHESAITFHIGTYLASNPVARMWGGEVGFLLRRNPDRVRAPDIAIMRRQRVPPAGFFEGAPDLAIEIVSPGDAADDVEEKVQEWLAAGAETVWVVYPTGPRLAVRRPDGSAQTYGPDDDVDGGPMLPGFRMRLSALLTPPGF